MACVAVCMVSAVARWLRQATRNRMIEAITASTPIQKCRRKETSRNNGNQGTSNSAPATGLPIAWRMVSKSRIACTAAFELRAIIRLRIFGASSASIRMLARTSSRLRIASSADRASRPTASAMVMNSRVVFPPVATTRS